MEANNMKKMISSTPGTPILGTQKSKNNLSATIIFTAMVLIIGMLLTSCSPSSSAASNPTANSTTQPQTVAGDLVELGGLDWRVLEVTDGKALLLSDIILSKQSFNTAHSMIAWDESDIRQYLNGEFYNDTFSEDEKTRIVETLVENDWNPWFPESNPTFTWYSMPKGQAVTDRIFLLSIDEVVQYFGDSGDLEKWVGGVTILNDDFNEGRVAQTKDGSPAWWWLRSPGLHYAACGTSFNNAACVAAHGGIAIEGNMVNSEYGGVRPALWITLEPAD